MSTLIFEGFAGEEKILSDRVRKHNTCPKH